MKEYLINCIKTNENCLMFGFDKDEHFIEEVFEEYVNNLKYVEDGYSEINAKDDAILTVFERWAGICY